MKRVVVLLCCFVALSFAAKACRVVAYSYMTPVGSEDFDYSRVTHLIGSFVNSDREGNLTFNSWTKVEDIVAVLREGKNKGVIPMIALGTTTDSWEMTKSKVARAAFISNLLTFCDTNGIEGIDLDLEGVAEEYNWGKPGTFFPEPYESLAVELREAMPDTMLLTSAVGSHSRNGAQWTDRFLAQLDFINVMIYDRALSWESSPVENHSTWESHAIAAEYWHKDRGIARERISLGVPFYARGWDRDNDRIYKEDPGWQVTTWDYRVFADRFALDWEQDSFDIGADDSLKHSRAEGVTGRATIFFNSPDLIGRKTQWTIDSSYGGVMIWHLGADVPTGRSNSLLRVMDSVVSQSTATINAAESSAASGNIFEIKELSLFLKAGSYDVSLLSVKGQRVQRESIVLPIASVISLRGDELGSGVYVLTVKDIQTQQVENRSLLIP